MYAHASEEIPFWEGAGIEWGKQYALDGVCSWWAVTELTGYAVAQRSSATLSSSWTASTCRARVGEVTVERSVRLSTMRYAESFARALMSAAASRGPYVESNLSNGVDWRNRVPNGTAMAMTPWRQAE